MMASDWNSVVPSSSTSAGSAICGLTLWNSSVWCALLSRSTNTTSVGSFFRLSAIRTRKLACDRQKEKNFMERAPSFFPSPLVGEGGRDALASRTGEGFSPRIETPHPASLREATFSHKGRREGRDLSSHGLLAVGQMHRASAAGRMRGDVVGGNCHDHWRRRLILRRNIIQHRRQPALGLGNAHALAPGVILDLVALDLADAEIKALGVAEIEPRHRRARPHRIA